MRSLYILDVPCHYVTKQLVVVQNKELQTLAAKHAFHTAVPNT
jgi:hypothetical protein